MSRGNNIDTGGPAFPVEAGVIAKGMTLRDYFAAKALIGLFSSGSSFLNKAAPCPILAQAAYAMADAMLEARK